MLEIIVIFVNDFTLQNECNITIAKDDDPLQPGNYYIHAAGKFLYNKYFVNKYVAKLQAEPFIVNNEIPLLRLDLFRGCAHLSSSL